MAKHNILVTGAAGFIGSFVSKRLMERGDRVVGVDNFNDYYDPTLKELRLERLLRDFPGFECIRVDVSNSEAMDDLFGSESFSAVVHLAAQAGVRHSLKDPHAYVKSNLRGFMNILEGCRKILPRHLVYASSSSVYGANRRLPFSEQDPVGHPLSLYGATKRSNELMAHCYAHLYGIPVSGLRFFTVYGPWGRPDMALFKFVKAIAAGEPIEVYNHGDMMRDFTYVDDIVEGVIRVIDHPASGDREWDAERPRPDSSRAPYRIYNIGNSRPVRLMDFISAIEKALDKKAEIEFKEMQPGDVEATYASVERLDADMGYRPDTPVEEGIAKFVEWYQEYVDSNTTVKGRAS